LRRGIVYKSEVFRGKSPDLVKYQRRIAAYGVAYPDVLPGDKPDDISRVGFIDDFTALTEMGVRIRKADFFPRPRQVSVHIPAEFPRTDTHESNPVPM
jgi:uncharacterized membrane protein YkvA (DUF1232 family)